MHLAPAPMEHGGQLGPLRAWPGGLACARSIGDADVGIYMDAVDTGQLGACQTLPRDLDECLKSQEELMTIPVEWPGFHALCIESFGDGEVSSS